MQTGRAGHITHAIVDFGIFEVKGPAPSAEWLAMDKYRAPALRRSSSRSGRVSSAATAPMARWWLTVFEGRVEVECLVAEPGTTRLVLGLDTTLRWPPHGLRPPPCAYSTGANQRER